MCPQAPGARRRALGSRYAARRAFPRPAAFGGRLS
jgi:hypothetical protein